jgi:hypothetical protein
VHRSGASGIQAAAMTKHVLRAALAVAILAASTPALAQATRRSPSPAPSTLQAPRIGPLIGLEFADGDAGLALRGDASVPLSRLSPTVSIDGVLSVGLSWFEEEFRNSGFDVSTTIFKVVPALRLTAPLSPTVGLYGDFGLGFYYGSTEVDDFGFAFDGDADDSGFGVGMRFAGGLFADVSPTVRLGGEVGVNPYFGELDETTVSLLFSAMFRL